MNQINQESKRNSVFIQLNKFCLVEFIRTDINNPYDNCVFSNVDVNMFNYPLLGYNQIYYDDKYVIVPDDEDLTFSTNNVEKYTVFDYDNTRYAKLVSSDGYSKFTEYFAQSGRVEINKEKNNALSGYNDVMYDTYRFHFASGFNINSCECIVLGIKARLNNGDYVKLANIKVDTQNWYDGWLTKKDEEDIKEGKRERDEKDSLVELNDDPIYINNSTYVYYVDVKVPSIDYLKHVYYKSNDIVYKNASLAGRLTDVSYTSDVVTSNGLSQSSPAIVWCDVCDTKSIFRGTDNVAYELYDIAEHNEGSLVLANEFELVSANIYEAEDGNYFKYRAEYDGNGIDTFLYNISDGRTGEWSMVHQMNVIEHVDDKEGHILNYTTSRNSMYQDHSTVDPEDMSYDEFLMFRPILKYAGKGCVSFTISYTLTMINNRTSENIVKSASISSKHVREYSKNTVGIDLNSASVSRHKVYNKIYISQDSSTDLFVDPDFEKKYRNGGQNSVVERSVKYPLYVDYNAITISDDITGSQSLTSTTVAYRQGDLRLLIKPFDNYLRFKIYTTTNGLTTPLVLDTTNTYKIVFLINGTKVTYESMHDENVDPLFKTRMSMGEITFKIPEADAATLVNSDTRDFYIVYDNYSTLQTSILYFGFWYNQNEYVEYQKHIDAIKESYGKINEVNEKLDETIISLQSNDTEIPLELYVPGNVDQASDGSEVSGVFKSTPTSQNS